MFFNSRLRAIGAAVALCVGAPGLLAQTAVAPDLIPVLLPAPAVATAAAPNLGAPSAAQPLSWAQALDAAWARSAESAAAAAAAQSAGAEQAAARSWLPGAPVLELGWRTDQFNRNAGARESEIGVALPLWLPGQRVASLHQAEAAAAVAQAGASAQRLQLAQALLEAAAAVQQQRLELAQRTVDADALRLLAADMQRLLAAGERARTDALAAQAELLQAQALLQQARSELQSAELRWQSLTGLSAIPALQTLRAQTASGAATVESAARTGAPVSAVAAAAAASEPAALAQHPLLLEAAARSQWAQRQLALVERSRRAAPELQTRWVQQVEARGAAATQSLGLTLRIPLHSPAQHNPQLLAAQGAYAQAQARQQELERQLQAQWVQQHAALAGLTPQIVHASDRAGQLRERAALIEKSFRSGETALADWLRTRAAATEAEATLQTLHLQQQIAQARLQLSFGILP